MPKHAKSTKLRRNRKMMGGIRKYLRDQAAITIHGVTYKPEELAAVYQGHLDKLSEVDEREAAWRQAVQEEGAMENRIKALTTTLNTYMRATFGTGAAKLLEFGIRPRDGAKPSAEKQAAAAEKRRQTRKQRWTMGSKQRKKIRGW
jgi:hypothetical protein